jgi:8-oxo-dGTP pyrophosphatase MutT (NUDIX family)
MKKIAGIVLTDGTGKVLAIHASKHPKHRWGVPKGKIDKGESPKQAAIREFREETGICLKKYKKKLKKLKKKKFKNKVFHIYKLKIKDTVDLCTFDGKEIDDITLLHKDEIVYK